MTEVSKHVIAGELETVTIERSTEPLETLLLWMSRYGKPRLGMYGKDGTWHCNIEMHVSSAGVSFEVKSDFTHKDPRTAVDLCRFRMISALKNLGVQP